MPVTAAIELLAAEVGAQRDSVPPRLAIHILRETEARDRNGVGAVLLVAEVLDPGHDLIASVAGLVPEARIEHGIRILVRDRVVGDVEELLAGQAEVSLD